MNEEEGGSRKGKDTGGKRWLGVGGMEQEVVVVGERMLARSMNKVRARMQIREGNFILRVEMTEIKRTERGKPGDEENALRGMVSCFGNHNAKHDNEQCTHCDTHNTGVIQPRLSLKPETIKRVKVQYD